MYNWHLIFTKPQKETQVNRLIQNRDLETFFPAVQINRGYGRGMKVQPFFPHYLFFRADLTQENTTGLQWLPGVRSLVSFGGRPAIVPDQIVAALRQQFEVKFAQTLHPAELLYKPGDEVRIVNGPFKGLEAIFQKGLNGTDRVQILLNLLGRWNETHVNLSDLGSVSGRQAQR